MTDPRSLSAAKERAALITALMQEAITSGYGDVDVSPHDFKPLKRWRNRGRCAVCMAHEDLHPAIGWLPSRPWRDKSEAIRGR